MTIGAVALLTGVVGLIFGGYVLVNVIRTKRTGEYPDLYLPMLFNSSLLTALSLTLIIIVWAFASAS